MERLTTNKDVSEMNVIELAHNSCYAKDGNARYIDYDLDIDARELTIKLLEEHADIPNEFTCDDDFDDFIADSLQYGTDDILGLIAVFYRNLCAMADLRERLKYYEDLEEQGKLLKLPCVNWMDIVFGKQEIFWGIDTDRIGTENPIVQIVVDNSERISWYDGWKSVILKGVYEEGFEWEFSPEEIGITVFLTKEDAETALKGFISEGGFG